MTDSNLQHPFEALTPDFVLDAIESQGFRCDGRMLALNSYENRVYQIGIEDEQPIIAKFYRPQRWTRDQIREEHEFSQELLDHELPVVAPSANASGDTLFEYSDFEFSLYPRKGGHAPELDNLDNLFIIGRLLGRMHLIGASRPFEHRPQLTSASFGHDSVALISEHFIPPALKIAYDTLTADLLRTIDAAIETAGDIPLIRVHGDCHIGNMLWRDDAPHFVDFDDARMAPAVQDIWMLLSGDRPRQLAQLSEIIEGYNEFGDFHPRELQLVEVLRTLRMLNYSAWLAERWIDPAFPRNFPWFNTERYWEEHILHLREQFAALGEPVLMMS